LPTPIDVLAFAAHRLRSTTVQPSTLLQTSSTAARRLVPARAERSKRSTHKRMHALSARFSTNTEAP